MKKEVLIIFSLLIIILVPIAFAQFNGAETSAGATGRITETDTGNQTAQGGNVTQLNLTSIQTTQRWQGFYGNVTGSLSLGFGSNVFYDFSGAAINSVFASQNSTFDFLNLQAGSAIDVDAAWNYNNGADQASDIYLTNTVIEGISAPSVEIEPAGSNFNSTILRDGGNTTKSNFIFGVNVQDPGVMCFDNSICEYELMVPSDGQEVYYFYLSLS